MPPRWQQPGGMAEVAQEMPETGEGATDFVLAGDTPLAAAQERLAAAARRDDDGTPSPRPTWPSTTPAPSTPRPRAGHADGPGLPQRTADAPVNSFSGGWRMRCSWRAR